MEAWEAEIRRSVALARTAGIWLPCLEAWELLLAEIDQLRGQIEGHCDRIAAQSELLSKRADK